MENIVFKVTPSLAKAFKNAGVEKKRLAEMMVNIWLKDLLSGKAADEKLADIMNHAGTEAQKNGLTPEILANMLDTSK